MICVLIDVFSSPSLSARFQKLKVAENPVWASSRRSSEHPMKVVVVVGMSEVQFLANSLLPSNCPLTASFWRLIELKFKIWKKLRNVFQLLNPQNPHKKLKNVFQSFWILRIPMKNQKMCFRASESLESLWKTRRMCFDFWILRILLWLTFKWPDPCIHVDVRR